MPRPARLFVLAFAATLLGACGGGGGGSSSGSKSDLSQAAQLGRKIFFDASLSASGQLSCATCHDPATGHAGSDGLAVPLGGPLLATPGFRNAPSLRYLNTTPAFSFDNGTPTGGFNRDGRANDLAAQAERPFLAAHEMDNVDHAAVVDKLSRAAYIAEFRSLFGAGILRDIDTAFARMQFALAQYEKEDPVFHSFDSKYDLFLAGNAQLSTSELRGLALYNAPGKGNCAACHPSGRGPGGAPPLFTDFTYDNLGVPRNEAVPGNADPAYYDLGLCGPFRTDLASRGDLCGAFKVPTLRNVAMTGPYFHNGRFASLNEVVRFYARRDTNPEEWYARAGDGSIVKFDDLPPAYRSNVNVTEVPYNRKPGDAPALDDQEVDDLVAFLRTLTDGYRP